MEFPGGFYQAWDLPLPSNGKMVHSSREFVVLPAFSLVRFLMDLQGIKNVEQEPKAVKSLG